MLALRRIGRMRLFDMRSDEAVRCLDGRRVFRMQNEKSAQPVTAKSRGRKPRSESRAEELRQQLNAWKRTPESSRSSLRAIARELGTTHQLLGHFLKGWEKWQAKEYRRQAKEIRVSAEAETRPWIVAEMLRESQAFEKAAFQAELSAMLTTRSDGSSGRQEAGSCRGVR
jgi:hypothetical protein